MDLRHLRYFLAVYDEGSFTRAAKRLHMAQPPLSRAIRQLEEELGALLFERSGRSVRPTAAADVFAVEARKVLIALANARLEVRRTVDATSALRIGAVPTAPADWLNNLAAWFREAKPRLRIDVVHLSSLEQIAALERGDLDLGILYDEDTLAANETFEVAALHPGWPHVGVVAPDHPLAANDTIRPGDVTGVPLIVVPRSAAPTVYDGYLRRIEAAGFRFSETEVIGGHSARDVILAVAAGRGIALLSAGVVEASGASGTVMVRKLEPAVAGIPMVLAWRRDPPPLVASAADLIREHAPA